MKQRTQQDLDEGESEQLVGMIRDLGTMYTETTDDQNKRLDAVERDLGVVADAVARDKRRAIGSDRLGTVGSDDPGIVTLGWDRDGNEVKAYTPKAKLSREKSDPDAFGRMVRQYIVGGQAEADAQKAMTGSQATAGGLLIAGNVAAEILDAVRAESQVIGAGALTVPMPGRDVTLARWAGDPVSTWRYENTAIPSSDPNLIAAVLHSRTLAAILKFPVELPEDASNFETSLRQLVTAAMAAELDRAALNGSGIGAEPLGALNAEGIQSIPTVGSLADYDDFSTAVEMLAIKSAEPSAVIAHPTTLGKLDRLKEATTNAPLRPPDSWRAIGLHLGTVSCPVASALVGDFSSLIIGLRGELRLEASRDAADSSGSAFSNLQIWLRAYLRADVGVIRPERFVALTGIA